MANAGVALNFLRPIFSSLAFFVELAFFLSLLWSWKVLPAFFCNEAAMSFPDYSGVTFIKNLLSLYLWAFIVCANCLYKIVLSHSNNIF